MRRLNDLKEQPLPLVPEIDEIVTEPDTDVLLNEDHLDHEFEKLNSADPSYITV